MYAIAAFVMLVIFIMAILLPSGTSVLDLSFLARFRKKKTPKKKKTNTKNRVKLGVTPGR